MKRGVWVISWVWGSVMLASGVAHAQCSKDIDCKGERVCEDGQCKEPAALPPPPAPPDNEPAPGPPSQAAPAPAPAPATAPAPDPHFFDDDEPRAKPKKKIGKPGMMAAGIVLTSAAPIVLVVGALSSTCNRRYEESCEGSQQRMLAFLIGTAALLGVGIPLIVIGAKRVPAGRVSALPWVAPHNAGLQLRLDL